MNFAQNKSANQSSNLNYYGFVWTADKAVDGIIDGKNPDTSKTCSAADGSLGNHTWTVDIGFSIIVKNITVYGRSDGVDQLSGLKVFVENVEKPWTDERVQPVYTFIVNDSISRFISVMRENKTIITICEVIIEGECQKGTFGKECNETCGNCLNGNISCNSTTGHCVEGCQQGWRNKTCKHRCLIGTYGYGCNETCGMCNNGNKGCSADDGRCNNGCLDGWQGITCAQECSKGLYGRGCNETCGNCFGGNNSCLANDGKCKFGCDAGSRGTKCKQGCRNGTYGYGCNEACGMCFNGNNSCSPVDGKCKFGCIAGLQGETCKQGCRKGKYGYGCNETCGMCYYGNEHCYVTDGHCSYGCIAGWQGKTCKQECSKGKYGRGCNEACGMCFRGSNSCSTVDGVCEFGCEAGWSGSTCKQGCRKGEYGYGCNETCGMCYYGNEHCSAIDGQCTYGCIEGRQGKTCKQECSKGAYGRGCNEICGMCFRGDDSCSTIEGVCEFGCEAGWSGSTCKQECRKGAYGRGCTETCGMCFRGNDSCSTVNGECQFGCVAGWWGPTCNQECEKGTYGYGCNETCGNCMYGVDSCSTINGTCFAGCQDGWKNEKCTQEIRIQATSSHLMIGLLVPAVIFIILLIIVLVVLGVKRKQGRLNKEALSMPKQEQNILQQAIKGDENTDLKAEESKDALLHKESSYNNAATKKQLIAQSVPVLSFWSYVMKKKASKEEFVSGFQEFKAGLTKTHEEALANSSKNRYKSIYPYDFNRVVLKRDSTSGPVAENYSDYINASYIKGLESCKCYIAAQGPIASTVDDFWWLVWQEQTECIVMLTNLCEMGKTKCTKYWPDAEEQTYGEVTVKFVRNESFADFVRREFQLSVRDKSRRVTQFHYTAWPDKDVPDTAWSLVEFCKSVRNHKSYDKGSIVVHCSAGVGRTGTFIALDIIYDESCKTGHVDIKKCVENLREQRVNMVQTANQFIFLHDVVSEMLGFGTVPVFKKQFSDVLRYLMEEEELSGLSRLHKQYNMLRNLNLEQEENNAPVYSNAEGFQSETIWLPNLSGKEAYVAGKGMEDEALLFTIRERSIKCLIIVDSSSPKNMLFSIGVGQSKTLAGFEITCDGKEDIGAFERNQFSITSNERKKPHKLTAFVLKTWEESKEVPSDSESVLSLLEDVSRLYPSPNELNPVLLYSRLELNRCSFLYVLLNEKDRIRKDGEIHILRTSAEMLERSRKLLPTFDQYTFFYQCIAADALQESIYENTAGIKRKTLSSEIK